MSFSDIISGLVSIGVNLTNGQADLLKWRSSPDAKKYYTEKENIDFYEALKKGNLEIVDAIRKEKQSKIDQMKTELLSLFLICLIPFMTSCSIFHHQTNNIPPVIQQKWNPQSLTEPEKTHKIEEQTLKVVTETNSIQVDIKNDKPYYKLEKQPIKIADESKSIEFKGNWYVVSEDFIKTYNENQDTLIKSLEKIKDTNKEADAKIKQVTYIFGGILAFCLMLLTYSIIKRRN